MSGLARQVGGLGQSIWIDDIRRDWVTSGELERMIRELGVVGMTSNPTIFNKAIAETDLYDADVERLVAQGKSADEIYEALAIDDIRAAADRLRPVHESTRGLDGWVSLEVSPELAHDTGGTIAEARRLRGAVDRPNVFIKVPATPEGIPAIRALIAEGLSVNVTLIFSLERHREVIEAYLEGLEERARLGQPLAAVRSVASFFVSRVDTIVDKAIEVELRATGSEGKPALSPAEVRELQSLKGRAAIANARMAYALFREMFGGARFAALAAKGANLQRPLWASTSTKNPAYRDTMYVDELIGADTVNTMPRSTLLAFDDHGTVAPALERDLEGARRTIERLEALGIAVEPLLRQLLVEGVESFAHSFIELREALEARSRAEHARRAERWRFDWGTGTAAVAEGLARMAKDRVVPRIVQRDATLWSADPRHQEVARNRLGWLDTVEEMSHRIDELQAFTADALRDGFRHAVLLGMGGSSLCPEVCRRVFGAKPGYLDVDVLDNTSPEAVAAVADALDWDRTLFIVSSKSGTTGEVHAFYHYFRDRLERESTKRGAEAFAAITDPGTPLEKLGRQYNFRKVFLNAPDIGGRYSALSYFGLVPAALLGVDLTEFLQRADWAAQMTEPGVSLGHHFAAQLGAALGALGQAGRDKLTLVLDPRIEAFGSWVEQLVAESLGKDGKGVVPVDGESLGPPDVYGPDRVFVHVGLGSGSSSSAAALEALRAQGHPVIEWTLPDTLALGGEFFRWEFATAAAGALLGVDPFDEPNVAEAKAATQALLAAHAERGDWPLRLATTERDGLVFAGPPDTIARLGEAARRNGDDAAAWIAAHVASARAGDYIALQAYLRATPERHAALQRGRLMLRDRTRLATTLGYGPRYLHSTGQLHKGGPNNGVFIQITTLEHDDLPIPGESYSFRTLRDAQALADLDVLHRRGRRVLRIHLLEVDAGLATLNAAIASASSHVPAGGR